MSVTAKQTPQIQPDYAELARQVKRWGNELGFQQTGIAGIELREDESRLEDWLALNFHGEMDYMRRHGQKRSRPAALVPGTVRVVTARMDYLPANAADAEAVLNAPHLAYISRYALGRDYHKVLRNRLQVLADRITAAVGKSGYRVFVDSAPVLEKALARNAGLGWIGKHTNLINSRAGSLFMLGELFTDLPLPVDAPAKDRCGTCSACIPACPTGAITAPYQLDARRCISYLTIEHHGPIPESLRPAIGNRIFGCDDCQLVCPWNKFAVVAAEPGFRVRHGLDSPDLIELFTWSEADYLERSAGSALRRLGYLRWQRNIAVALGNAPTSPDVIRALESRRNHPDPMLREHVEWALSRHRESMSSA